MNFINVKNPDVHFVKRYRLQNGELGALNVQGKIVNSRVSERSQDGVNREALELDRPAVVGAVHVRRRAVNVAWLHFA